ncbi:MAG: HAMP domain-containing protein [Treponema sp.]|jgi:nitrogen fixation/metabolism regulation signal transduction histidine kinase|nr:HAMP domain-containing protein [Treponema sp.]
MKTVRIRPRHSILNVRGLIFIYALLCALIVLFSRSFFFDTLYEGKVPGRLNLVVFFTIPAVLLIFLGLAAAKLIGDIIARRPGIKFATRLLAYFVITVVFAAAPLTIVTGISINEIIRFWRGVETGAAKAASHSFAVDNYSFHLEHFKDILGKTKWDALMASAEPHLPADIASVQDFQKNDAAAASESENGWTEIAHAGDEGSKLMQPPSETEGFVTRELPRDTGYIRYVILPARNTVRLVSYYLGRDFDWGMAAIEKQGERFDVINVLRDNAQILMLFYYGVFFAPSLLMTVIIAISFTQRVTNPIVELTEATRRVAEGDFSIQILARRGDELGLLIRSFNAMVHDLEKSREALVKTEKISIWQNMAQQLAHEIKNPLTPIKLSAERVLRRWRNTPEQIGEIIEDSMLAIIQETEGLSTLLNEFRTLSRPIEPSQSWTRIQETVEEALSPYRSSYPETVFVTEHIGGNISVKIDKHRFIQVLTNLLINAIDAMDGKGHIELRTDFIQKREIRFCRLSVKDSGKGITRQTIPQVFTPYFTTKESGTGLGLPIVERIVNDHGGSIWFNTAEGMGTTFFVDLPVTEENQT